MFSVISNGLSACVCMTFYVFVCVGVMSECEHVCFKWFVAFKTLWKYAHNLHFFTICFLKWILSFCCFCFVSFFKGCAEDEYDCEDATCIAGNLKCNGRSNCKFLWDEEGCKVSWLLILNIKNLNLKSEFIYHTDEIFFFLENWNIVLAFLKDQSFYCSTHIICI